MELNIELIRKGYNYTNKFDSIVEEKIKRRINEKYVEYLKISDGFRVAYNSNLQIKKINKN